MRKQKAESKKRETPSKDRRGQAGSRNTEAGILNKEDIQFLRELGTELKTQDNMSTAKPIFFQVYEEKIRTDFDPDYTDNVCIVLGDDYVPIINLDEAKEFIKEYYIDKQDDLSELEDIDNFQELTWFCENRDIPAIYTGFKKYRVWTNVFLTRKACRKHIKQNAHYYAQGKDTQTWCSHAWQNQEFKRLLEIVDKFAEKGDE